MGVLPARPVRHEAADGVSQAFPGDTLAMRVGVMRVNGTELDESYVGPDERSDDFGSAACVPGAGS